MSESTKDMLFSFVPLTGWFISLNADPLWQAVGTINLVLAFIVMFTAIAVHIRDYRQDSR